MSQPTGIQIHLTVKNCLPTEVEAQALVIPTSSKGFMSQGTGKLVKRKGGADIEQEILKIAPMAIGSAAVTKIGGISNYSYAIHVPNRLEDRAGARIEHVRLSVRAGLVAAHAKGYTSIVIPGPGPCASHISKKEIARAIIDEIRNFKETPPESVILVDTDEQIFQNLQTFAFPQK